MQSLHCLDSYKGEAGSRVMLIKAKIASLVCSKKKKSHTTGDACDVGVLVAIKPEALPCA